MRFEAKHIDQNWLRWWDMPRDHRTLVSDWYHRDHPGVDWRQRTGNPELDAFRVSAMLDWYDRSQFGCCYCGCPDIDPTTVFCGEHDGPADRWLDGGGGTETPYTHHGVRYLRVWNPGRGKHGTLNLDTDIVEEDA